MAEETLAIEIFCCLRHPNHFVHALRAAVNHSGDSDSTGSLVSQLMGVYLGLHHIPNQMINQLELHDIILDISKDEMIYSC